MAKILIADDNKINRTLLKAVLSESDKEYDLVEADSGENALEIVAQELPDIILLDIMMPGMDGYEVCAKLKSDDRYKAIPILFITAMETVEDKVKGFDVGAADYITKPIRPEEVKARVNAHLTIKATEEARMETEMQLLQASKMAAMGEMGAGVAHELNQPLMAITTHLETLSMNKTISSDEKLSLKIRKIQDQFVRLKSIVKRLSDFSKGRTEALTMGDIKVPINDSIFLFAQQFKDHNIELDLQLDADIPEVFFDRYQIQDIILNFLVNARDAIDDVFNQEVGGKIGVYSKLLKEEGVVTVAIKDNGKPIDPKTEEKLFDAFFTTKGPEKGTGLGLSVCRTIISNHKGLLSFIILSDGSKMFWVALPLAKEVELIDDETIKPRIEKRLKEE
jgi:C4-dicarboxylate-specific signal transduction histidine kinase